MSQPSWILTKLGNATGIPIICSTEHPDYSAEKYDIKIGQACFERNWNEGKLVNIADNILLAEGHHVFAFKDFLNDVGIEIPA
tara:strand:+ start:430 stop:678 length:249 start_codon:yes stop_codon:yes gene_type:complete